MSEIVIEQDFEYTYDWPEGVPHNYEELVRDWGDFIAARVKHFNKVERNFEDLLQDVWMRLMNAKFLERFVGSAAARLPTTMTAEQAIVYLGVTWKQWEHVLRRNTADEEKWAPKPIGFHGQLAEGEEIPLLSRQAVFLTEEIKILDEIDPWRTRPNERKRPTITARGFKAYLTQAIRNHFANFCRTRNRKYKDTLLNPTAVVVTDLDQPAAGYHLSSTEIESVGGWEANVVALMLGDDDALSVKHEIERQFTSRGIDPTSPQGQDVLDFIIHSTSFDATGLTAREERKAINAVFAEAFRAQERAAERAYERENPRQVLLRQGGPKFALDLDAAE